MQRGHFQGFPNFSCLPTVIRGTLALKKNHSAVNGYPVERMNELKCECGSERLGLQTP